MKKVKWGIIAAGGIARRRTLPAMHLVDNAEIIAVMDTNNTALQEIKEEYSIPYCYDNVDDLLANDEVEAVYIASPVCFHKEQAIKAINAGKHILLEKPIALDINEAKEIMAAAKSTDKKVGIAMIMRFHQGHIAMKEAIARGEIGDIVSCRAQLTCWFPDMENNWRQIKRLGGGGALVDMGVHCIDLLHYILDDDFDRVYGEVGTKTFKYEVDDSADCILHTKKGATCFVDTHFNIPDEAANGVLEIYGTKGSFLCSGTISQEGKGNITITTTASDAGYDSAQVRTTDNNKVFEYTFKNPYAEQITEFSDAIINDTRVSTTLDDAFKTMEIVEALYMSSDKKSVIIL